ncbi:Small subunit processome component [Candidozyma auris]|uniref:U three protein 23 n=2 Tax=Candidozyma auris TaxID=498019 RepID=A0ABF7SXU1_CANAR|nr:hypothetical protein QG37_00658 [[Candida] auris]PIS56226.1 hypothetical protein CJI97_001473 [[Candida] auris]PIS56596.1 hypothetical protein B9J08_001133 [[Candida] auris]QWW24121.1 hypothetical protein CA7LBN_002955 [[Candida] auris]
MRQKRAKSYKKQMNVYLHTFKFREPFQIIVDDELVLTCNKASFNLTKGLERTIQGEAKPMITQCCMQSLYLTKDESAIALAKSFERRRCNHFGNPKPSKECIESIVNIDGENKHRYVVATQDVELRRKLRGVPGVPLVFMNRSVMVMEPASNATMRAAALSENAKLTGGLNDTKIGYVKKDEEGKDESEQPQKKKRKGPKEPNPLSVKKKKTGPNDNKGPEKPKKKRARRHKKSSEKNADENGNDDKDIKDDSQ